MSERKRVNQARRTSTTPTRDKESSAPGGRLSLLTFFGEIKKESRKVSGARCRSAQQHQEKFRGERSACRPWRFLYLKCLRATTRQPAYLGHLRAPCPEVLYPRGFRSLSPTEEELEKRESRSVVVSSKRSGLKPTYLGHLRDPCPEALYL